MKEQLKIEVPIKEKQDIEPISTELIMNLTIFHTEHHFIEYIATEWLKQIIKKLNYKILKVTCGKHVDASREHYHIFVKCDTNGAKLYKDLQSKIHREGYNIDWDTKQLADQFREITYAVSVMYKGETKKVKKKVITYGEEAMRYPFKEYDSFEKVELELQSGFTKPELKSLWEQASQDWRNVKKRQNEVLLQQLHEKDEFENLNSYLESNLKTYLQSDMEVLIHKTMVLIWDYKKTLYKAKKCKSTRVGSIKDQAISYLVFNEYITTENIVSLTY